jgi:hypothetical protein
MHPLVNRTSPKGTPFVGTCAACGTAGLTYKTMLEDCPNQRRMTNEKALLESINGTQTKEA